MKQSTRLGVKYIVHSEIMTLHSVIVMFAWLHTHYHYRENTVLTVVIYESYTSLVS